MPPEPPTDGDWQSWSREAVQMLQQRRDDLMHRHGLGEGTTYEWDLDAGRFVFENPTSGSAAFALVCVGTTAPDGTFLWGWANDTHPAASRRAMHRVRDFGATHDLPLLVDPMWEGRHAEALEMLAIAARVLDADGFFVEPKLGVYLLLFEPDATAGPSDRHER